jgi:hypothetical protein
MGRLTLILFLLAPALAASAAQTNYFCIICGKGPLTGRIWIAPRGAICESCNQIENRCSICALPVRLNDGGVRTGDGRFICKFDRTNAVLDAAAAQAVFTDARRKLIGLFGSSFALKYPAVTVNVFDVDYWSERGRSNNLHKSGFSSTRKSAGGECVHTVVLWSGRPREEVMATSAHEYTHLWINENCPDDQKMDDDTVEAVCELAAYCLMSAQRQPEIQKRILESPYTHGKIKTLVALGQQRGMLYVLTQVKSGAVTNLEPIRAAVASAASMTPAANAGLPVSLKFTGFSASGTNRLATINGKVFGPGDKNFIRLRNRTSVVICREIRADEVLLDVDGAPKTLKLEAR